MEGQVLVLNDPAQAHMLSDPTLPPTRVAGVVGHQVPMEVLPGALSEEGAGHDEMLVNDMLLNVVVNEMPMKDVVHEGWYELVNDMLLEERLQEVVNEVLLSDGRKFRENKEELGAESTPPLLPTVGSSECQEESVLGQKEERLACRE